MLRVRELTNQSVEELEMKHLSLCRDIFQLMCELKLTRKLEKPHLLKEKRLDRARVLTILRQKKQPKEV